MKLSHTFISLLFVSTCGAQTLSLQDIARRVHTANPDLAAARLRIEEARGRLVQSGRLSNPELEFDFSRNTMGREGNVSIALMQRFPLTAKLAHEKAASRAQLAAAEAEVRDAERKLVAQAQTLAVKLVALRQLHALRERQIGNSKDLSTFLLQRVQTGETPAIDAAQVELETRQLQAEQLQLAVEETSMTSELRPLIGLSGSDRIHLDSELASPQKAAKGSVDGRPDIEAAQHNSKAAEAALAKERASRLEDIGLGTMWERERTKDDPNPTETEEWFGFKVSVPLPIWNSNQGRIQEAKAAAERSRREADALFFNANAEANAARAEMFALVTLLEGLDSQLLPKAREIEKQQRQLYSTGQTPLTDVLRARSRTLDLERQRVDALRNYHLARVRLESATGKNLRSSR